MQYSFKVHGDCKLSLYSELYKLVWTYGVCVQRKISVLKMAAASEEYCIRYTLVSCSHPMK